MSANLPAPSPEALAHSAKLCELIRNDIAAQGGWIPFSRFMELALYAPGLGYYTAGARKFGEAGDFITAPELSILFGRTVARQLVEVMQASTPHILELGAGSGKLAAGHPGRTGTAGCTAGKLFDPRSERRPARTPAGAGTRKNCRISPPACIGWMPCRKRSPARSSATRCWMRCRCICCIGRMAASSNAAYPAKMTRSSGRTGCRRIRRCLPLRRASRCPTIT